MKSFQIGDTVRIEKGVMQHSIGTVVYFLEKEQKYLVRIGSDQQLYYLPEDLRLWEDTLHDS
ncbi:hypothetical protein MFLO_15356 [Listeria floridensis FSL S10-1187]|uniref:Uncharacterized protein n=1 Tax=Listeria floridensis FSL S10-1187 TaxID=1265817 RepID=A0ABP3AW94_9LIST|nr:hypothetical protein [Listeria floridensis]EUJ25487.1 hypothetical protein MFLO_15356 [Listeria floridensis FSL S10-1187]